jgi:hypothetical protein
VSMAPNPRSSIMYKRRVTSWIGNTEEVGFQTLCCAEYKMSHGAMSFVWRLNMISMAKSSLVYDSIYISITALVMLFRLVC